MKVEMVYQNESVFGYGDPSVTLYVNDIQRDKVWAYIDKEQGADGGWYSVIRFRRDNPQPSPEIAPTETVSLELGGE